MSVDIEKLVEELRVFMEQISKKRGEFNLFGLFLREEAPDKWDLVVSAPWLEKGKLKALGEFSQELAKAIGHEKVMWLSRIVTLNADDPALEAISGLGVLSTHTLEIQNSDVHGLEIKHAYILWIGRQPEPSSAI